MPRSSSLTHIDTNVFNATPPLHSSFNNAGPSSPSKRPLRAASSLADLRAFAGKTKLLKRFNKGSKGENDLFGCAGDVEEEGEDEMSGDQTVHFKPAVCSLLTFSKLSRRCSAFPLSSPNDPLFLPLPPPSPPFPLDPRRTSSPSTNRCRTTNRVV
jgi:hypothetical protein